MRLAIQFMIATINTIVRISIAATIVLTAITFALEVRRFVRMRPEGSGRID